MLLISRPFLTFMLMFVSFVGHLKAASAAVLPSDVFDAPKIVAIENRAFNPKKDITLDLAFLPLDAFFKGTALGLAYTHSFRPYLAWEVGRVHWSKNQDTHLKRDLIENFNVRPQGLLDEIEMTVSSNLVYTPIYSKNLLFNEKLVHGSLSMVAGLGSVKFTSGQTASMYGAGLYYRFFSSSSLSYKLDGRIYAHQAKDKSTNTIMYISVGLAYELGDNKAY